MSNEQSADPAAMMRLYPEVACWHNRRASMRHLQLLCVVALGLPLTGCRSSDPSDPPAARVRNIQVPGIQADGAVRLPNQWLLRPAGKQFLVGDFPVNIALHPAGKFAAVLHCGNGPQEIIVLEIPGGRPISRAGLDEAFYGITFSRDGT